jgi:hypothetical protein
MSALSSQPRRNPIVRIFVIGISLTIHVGLALYLYRQIPPAPVTTEPSVEVGKMP